MITIRYACDGGQHRLDISGHAGYAPRGRDIVCAGVSALALALLAFLRQDESAELRHCTDGALALRCPEGEPADSAFRMALLGWRHIAETYPQYAEVDILPRNGADKREKTAGKERADHAQQYHSEPVR